MYTITHTYIGIIWILFGFIVLAQKKGSMVSLEEIEKRLNDSDPSIRKEAAEALATYGSNDVVAIIRKHLDTEQEFHTRLALYFALALHGEKSAVKVLIESLSHTQHFGYSYLRRVSGQDFGWDVVLWRNWFEKTNDDDFRRFTAQQRLPVAVRRAGWKEFLAAVTYLQDQGDREEAANRFQLVFNLYPDSDYAIYAYELGELLRQMVAEDRRWKEPIDLEQLSTEERIAYNIYRLRDVNCYQVFQPGKCDVLRNKFGRLHTDSYNAAVELYNIGSPAILSLIEILDDRRPIRSVGYRRSSDQDRIVLRYQDAAIQILNELLPAVFYRPSSTGSYFSNEYADVRAKIISNIRNWYEESRGKSHEDQKWLAVKYAEFHSSLALLRQLAIDHPTHNEDAITELHRMYEQCHWLFHPHIAELLAELGDTSKIAEILTFYRQQKYSDFYGTAGIEAEEIANRLFQKYGTSSEADAVRHE